MPKRLLVEITALLDEIQAALDELVRVDTEAGAMEKGSDQAKFYYEKVCPAMTALREPVDRLEMIMDKSYWPMPSYGDLLFGQ